MASAISSAAQTNIGAPEPAHSIQIAIAITIINIGTLGGGYRQGSLLGNGIKDLPGMQKMALSVSEIAAVSYWVKSLFSGALKGIGSSGGN